MQTRDRSGSDCSYRRTRQRGGGGRAAIGRGALRRPARANGERRRPPPKRCRGVGGADILRRARMVFAIRILGLRLRSRGVWRIVRSTEGVCKEEGVWILK